MKKDIAIIYMVAGISSRFGGKIKQFTKIGPAGETLIEYSLMQALPAGFSKIIFIVGKNTEQPFKEMFGASFQDTPVYYAFQSYNSSLRDKPWGTVDALCSAKEIIDCPFVICNGDDIYGKNTFKILFDHLQDYEEEATVGYRLIDVIPETGSVNRGIFQIDKDNYVCSIKEVFNITKADLEMTKTKPGDLCSMNIFALNPKTIDKLSHRLNLFKKEHKGDRKAECLLPVEISKLIENKEIVMKLYPVTDKWFGITNPGDEEIIKKNLINTEIST